MTALSVAAIALMIAAFIEMCAGHERAATAAGLIAFIAAAALALAGI